MKRVSILLLLAFFLPAAALAANSWKAQTSPVTDILRDVHFISDSVGIAVGDDLTILKTTDQGVTWTAKIAPASGITMEAVDFSGTLFGYAVGNNNGSPTVFKTTDGGENWVATSVPGGGTLNEVSFYSTSEGFVCGNYTTFANVYKTSTGGSSWSLKNLPLTGVNHYGIEFVNSTTGWVVGAGGRIYKWNSGSQEWDQQPSGVSVDPKDVYFINTTTGWVVGGNKALRTTDGGTNWSSVNVSTGGGTQASLEAVYFSDSDNGWAVGKAGSSTAIFRSTDRGVTWNEDTSYSGSAPLYGVHRFDANNAVAVGGSSSLILKYSPDPAITTIEVDGRPDRPINYSGTITIEGTNFQTAATVSATGIDISVSSITSTRITGVATLTASGTQTVTVYNPDTGSGSGTVTGNPLPSLISANPSTMTQGTSGNVIITGTGFQSGITASDLVFSLSGITVNSVTVDSQYQITASVAVSASAATGTGDIAVTNPDTGSGTGSGIFSVTPSSVTNNPTVESVSPGSATQGATVAVTISGANFLPSPTVIFGNGGITVNSVTFNSSTSLGVNITISATAATTSRTVTVQNTDSGIGSKSNAFQVVSASAVYPTISSITNVPTFGAYQGTGGEIYITGTGFQSGASVTLDPPNSIIINNIEFISSTALRVDLSIAANALIGARDLTVTNTDGGFATSTGGLVIKALSSPAALTQPIPIFFSQNPVPNNFSNVIAQFDWPGPPDVVKFVMIGGGGLPLKAPWNVNVNPGINNVVIDANTQLGHKLGVGIHPLLGINSNKVVVKGLLVVEP